MDGGLAPRTVPLAGRDCAVFGDLPARSALLLQPTDAQEADLLSVEARLIGAGENITLVALPVDWDSDLTPWRAKSVFRGQRDFGDGAEDTLAWITGSLLPALGPRPERVFLGGYSLAGLFALWAGCRSDAFDGVAAVSPSVWYPGWTDWPGLRSFRCPAAYLSLGDAEERTRHPVMRTVGDALRRTHGLLCEQGIRTTLVWNPGNHFRDPAERTAAGFRWLLGG